MSDSDDAYGPPLPPGFSGQNVETSSEDESYGPALPGNGANKTDNKAVSQPTIGPVLPPHLVKTDTRTDSEESDQEDRSIGPALPPHLSSGRNSEQTKSSRVYGPVMPRQQDDDDDDEEGMVGPSISMQTSGQSSSALEDFESRAQKMRDKLTGKDDQSDQPIERETWMTELPPEIVKNFGLTNRQFRKNAAPTRDQAGWTDTPADKERKEKEGRKRKHEKTEEYVPSEKDIQTAKEIEEYNKAKRPESLLEMHQKKLKKKKKKKDKEKGKDQPKERRPFDRDLDLQVNKLDEAQRRAIIKRSQELGSRFKSGGTGTSFL